MRKPNTYLLAGTPKNRVRTAVISIALALAALPVLSAQASEPVGFSVKAVQSAKQVDKKASYFDLMLEPGEKHVLEVDIFNTSQTTLTASVTANTAGTNSGGVIDYSTPGVTDDSLRTPFESLAQVDEPLVSIPANSSRRVAITVNMPQESFDGVMLGGIAIKKTAEENAQQTSATIIQNEYCYIIGVKIRQNDTAVAPGFRLRSVGPSLSNYHTCIAANLQNYMPAIVKGLKIDAAVYHNDASEPLYTSASNDFDVAPNSNFDYIIPCAGKLAAGSYRLVLTAAAGESAWEFDEAFTVSGTVANDFNTQAVNVPGVNYYKTATVCLGLLLIVILAVLAAKWMRERREGYN